MSGPEKSGALTVRSKSGTTTVFFPERILVSSLWGMSRLERCMEENGSNEDASNSEISLGGTFGFELLSGRSTEATDPDRFEVEVLSFVLLFIAERAEDRFGVVLLLGKLLTGL